MMSNQWSPAIGWLILFISVTVYAVLFDLHAYFVHGRTLSGQFHDWLVSPVIGPFLFAVWAGVFIGLTFHWFQIK